VKEVFLDVGELGWSFYLSAHMRWLKKTKDCTLVVMTLPGRECLYEDIVDEILKVPDEFLVDFDLNQQNRFVLCNANGVKLRGYLDSRLPKDYFVSISQPFDCHLYYKTYVDEMQFEPYAAKTEISCSGDIFVFPRCRKYKEFRFRNLSKTFYIELINKLCDEFKNHTIRTMGTANGAYDIIEVERDNYINFVGATSSLQFLIDAYQKASCAVGSQSAPMKLALLQGVPSFMIGHEQERHVKQENWAATKAGFYSISKADYNTADVTDCIDEIVNFIRGCV